MTARLRVHISRILLAPFVFSLAFAQDPPPGVDQALRTRVTEFLNLFVSKQFRKALPYVAEDTQDEFFAGNKAEMKSFTVDNVKYNQDFTKATVNITAVRVWRIQGQEFNPPIPMAITWKIENGQWMWYHDVKNDTNATPMALGKGVPVMADTSGLLPQLPTNITEDALQSAAKNILGQSGLDRSEVNFDPAKPGSAVVNFHNGAMGPVEITMTSSGTYKKLKVTLDKKQPGYNESSAIHIEYTPDPADGPGFFPPATTLFVNVSPFNQTFPITVDFTAGAH